MKVELSVIIISYNLLNSVFISCPFATADFLWGSAIYLFFTWDALEECHSESCICVWRSLPRQQKERKNLKVSLVVFQVRSKLFGKLNSFWRHKLSVLFAKWNQQAWGVVFWIITRYYYMRECDGTEVQDSLVKPLGRPIWRELSSGNTMGFGTEGSLVLKNENRKRISNKEFQVSLTDIFVTVTYCLQYSLEISPRSQRE